MMSRSATRAAAGAAAVAMVAAMAATTAFTGAEDDPGPGATETGSVGGLSAAAEDRARRAFAALPLAFEANQGQSDGRVEYLARGQGFNLFLTRQGAVFDLRGAEPAQDESASASAPAVAVALEAVGANPTPRIVGRFRQRATSSYFRGTDPGTWQRGVPTFGRVRYRALYPGIDLEFRGDRSGAEYDFVVAPGADPDRIGYRLEGTDELRLDRGDLVASTPLGDFVHHAPIAFQRVGGVRRAVEAGYQLADGVVSFAVGTYDPSRPLVIDPDTDLAYSTYLGGADEDGGSGIALDGGDVYVTGYTRSSDFPTTTGAYDTTRSESSDVFVTRFSPDGAGPADLVYSTFLGGAGLGAYWDDEATGIAVEEGEVYLTGATSASDFPTTAGAHDRALGGRRDAFVARISPDGAGAADLAYSTFLGGASNDRASTIAVEGGEAYVAGTTSSSDFPTTPGALEGFPRTGFMARISPAGAGSADLVYSTFLDGNVAAVAVAGGHVYVTGDTYSSEFPTTTGAYDRSHSGGTDGFVARISPDGAGTADLIYSTYVGGSSYDGSNGIAVSEGDAYITGLTSSTTFPTTPGAHDRSYDGRYDAFVARISPDGAGAADLVYSSFLGGSDYDRGNAIDVDGGDLYVVGTTGRDDRYGGAEDILVARLSADGAGARDLVDYRELGENGADDSGAAIAVEGGTAYLTGETMGSWQFSITTGAYDTTLGGYVDAFVTGIVLPGDRPDGWIRRGRGPDLGDDVYNTTGRLQTASVRAERRHRAVFWVTAQNDGSRADTEEVTGPKTSRRWAIRYYRAGTDITGQVTGPGYRTPSLAIGEEVLIKVTIRPRAPARIGSTKTVRVLLASVSNPFFEDAVKANVTVRRP